MGKEAIWTGPAATAAPYTPGIKAGSLVFVSGQVPMDPTKRQIVQGDFETRVRQCIANVENVLRAAGATLEDVVKVTVFLTDMDCFARLNAVYSEYWGDPKPARSCVGVAGLPLGVDVEIEAIAVVP
ncbi:MAG: deaminase [Armatimonadetes bacterium]|nr:deaminase [Armatimonadota bacterium]